MWGGDHKTNPIVLEDLTCSFADQEKTLVQDMQSLIQTATCVIAASLAIPFTLSLLKGSSFGMSHKSFIV